MKKKDLKELQAKSSEEVKNLADVKKVQLLKLKAELKIGKHKNLRAGKMLRREIAQIRTILKERIKKQ